MKVIRGLGLTPAGLGNTTGATGSPDILEFDDGDVAVIGRDITNLLDPTPLPDARCADGERTVLVPRSTLLAAPADIPV